jgi:hypothetical protein
MHLAEAALKAAPDLLTALQVKLAATELLLAQCSRENFSETRWLEAEIRHLSAVIESTSA